MKVIFNITENKNKATFQQEVVKINTSFNQTQNIVKPKFQIGYYPLPVGLENYYSKNETDLLLENYYLKSETYSQNEIDDFLDLKADLSSLGNYYTKLETYSQTEIDNSLALKLDKGTYTGNASDLKDEIDNIENSKLDIPIALGHGVIGYWYNLYGNVNNFIGSELYQDVTGNIGVSKTNPTEKLDVNGNVKATQIKDQYGTLKSQRVITITGNTTLSEIHNGAILHITNTCNITIPTGLDANFQCVIFAKGSVIVTFVNGGVTVYAPSGLLLKTDKMASLFASASNTFNLLGELATS